MFANAWITGINFGVVHFKAWYDALGKVTLLSHVGCGSASVTLLFAAHYTL